MLEEVLVGKSGSSHGNRNETENGLFKQGKYAIYTQTLKILYIITSNTINSLLSARFE